METTTQSTARKKKVKDDLKPIYDKVKEFGENAFGRYRIRSTGEIWFVCKTTTSSLALYTRMNKDKTRFLVTNSYSGATKLRSVSGWKWFNLDVDVKPEVLSEATSKFIPFLYKEGVSASPRAAENEFISSLNATGDPKAQEAARKVPRSVSAIGGMIVAPLVVNLIWLILTELWQLVNKVYRLNIHLTNNAANTSWKVIEHYSDNVAQPGESWRPADLPKLTLEGDLDDIPGADEKDAEATRDEPSRHAYSLTNDSTFLQGLGTAMTVARDDMQTGFALKYDIRFLRDNKLALHGPIDPRTFDLKNYFENGPWASGLEATTEVDGIPIKGRTNALNGADGGIYLYQIDMELPPPPKD